MSYDRFTRIADRIGITGLLDRLNVRGPISDAVRLSLYPEERKRWRIIRSDFESCAPTFRRIVAGLPEGEQKAWMITSLPTVSGLKLEGVMSIGVRMAGLQPVAVHMNHQTWNRRYHGLFGIKHYTNFAKYLARVGDSETDFSIRDFTQSRPKLRDLLNLQFHQVDVGRIALSNILNQNKFSKFDINRPETVAELAVELAQIQKNVLAAEEMFDTERPAIGFLLEKGLSPMAEIFGVCVWKGIPVIQYTGSQNTNDFVLRRITMENRHQHPFSLDRATWERVKQMPWSETLEEELMTEFDQAYRRGAWFNRKFLHKDKKIKPAAEVRNQLGLDPSKKTAVIFSHVLWDATFFYGEGLFDDYETWLIESVRAAAANRNLNWVVKLHPDLVWKLKYEGFDGELRDVIAIRSSLGKWPDHIKLVLPDTDISSYSFFGITDYALTVRGTIGIEMACHGIPVVTAGTGRYSGLGFTIDSATPAEYIDRLRRLEMLSPMPEKQLELARRFAHALFEKRPWKMRSFEMVRLPIEKIGDPLDHNIVPHVKDPAELVHAEDMLELANWIASGQTDYLQPDVFSLTPASLKCVES